MRLGELDAMVGRRRRRHGLSLLHRRSGQRLPAQGVALWPRNDASRCAGSSARSPGTRDRRGLHLPRVSLYLADLQVGQVWIPDDDPARRRGRTVHSVHSCVKFRSSQNEAEARPAVKAVRFPEYGAPGVLRCEDVEQLTPGAGEVRIRVAAMSFRSQGKTGRGLIGAGCPRSGFPSFRERFAPGRRR